MSESVIHRLTSICSTGLVFSLEGELRNFSGDEARDTQTRTSLTACRVGGEEEDDDVEVVTNVRCSDCV